MIRTALIVGVLSAGCSTVHPAWSIAATDDATRRTTTTGEVVGGPGRYGSHAWLGIPFAAPPVGPLRWRAPQPHAAWTTAFIATKFGRACVQPATLFVSNEESDHGVLGSEDCLSLNLWAPPFDKLPQGEDRLPVMVWIHGGGNTLGNAASYDLGHLATGQRVLAVAVQYRLGPLGWFRNAALRDGDPVQDSGNYGTLDLIAALEWVRDNAAAFGGNPDNVTIFGESAGGQNVYSLLLSPKAKGLFHRAIAQSPVVAKGTLTSAENFSDDPLEPGHKNSSNEALVKLLIRDGTAADRAAAKQQLQTMGPAKVAEYLRGRSAEEIIRAYKEGGGNRLLLEMPLVLPDGVVQPRDTWLEAFARPDGWNQVPVLAGTNLEEAKLFLFLDPKFTWKLFGVLPRIRDENKYQSSSETMSRLWKARSVDSVAEAMKTSGTSTPFYAYRFDFAKLPTKLGTDLTKMLGAAHGMEIQFVHGHFEGPLAAFLSEEGRAEREALSNAMMGYWAQFARTGKPGTGGAAGSPEWLPYEVAADAPKFMTFDATPPGLRMGNSVERAPTIIADLIADPRNPDLAEKCEGLKGLEKAGFLSVDQFAKDCPP